LQSNLTTKETREYYYYYYYYLMPSVAWIPRAKT